MGALSFTFEVLSLAAFFAVFSSWSFKYVFNHDIIRNYAHGSQYKKSQINGILERQINATYGCRLLRLEVEDEVDGEDKAAFSASESDYFPRNGRPVSPIGETYGYVGHQNGHFPEHPNGNYPGQHTSSKKAEHRSAHYIVGMLFSSVVTLSFELVLLLMIQLFGSVDLNLAVFRFVITALVVLVTLVQPPLVISLYVNQHISPKFSLKSPVSMLKTLATAILVGLWFLLLARFGALAHGIGPEAERSFLEDKTNEIVLAGITITALLSGVGCMSTPIRTFWVDGPSLRSVQTASGRVEEVHLNELIQSYNSTKMLKTKRQVELNQLLRTTGGKVYNAPENDSLRSLKGSGRQLLNRVQSFTSIPRLTGSASEEDELQREIASLEELQESIYADFSKKVDLFLQERRSAPNNTMKIGRVLAVCHWLFSLYCVYRIVNVLFLRLPYHYFWSSPDLHRESNIIDDRDASESLNKNTKDALAITIAKIIQGLFGYLPISETQLINQVSFILSGSLFVCSFQNVLVTFKSLGRFLPTSTTTVNANVKTWVKHLIVSEFMAIYVIATALLIRSNLPPETAASMSKILSLSPTSAPTSTAQMLTEVEFIDTWFDKVFGGSCVVTFLIIAMKLFIENDSIYEGGYDEEMIIEDNSGLKQS